MRSVYLDNAATTYPKPEEVYLEIDRFMRVIGGSAGRSGHRRAVESGRVVFETRAALAGLLGVKDPLRIAFTKNATEAINIAIRGLLRPGDHVITTSVEHNSVMRPLEHARRAGVSYSIAQCAPDGSLDPSSVERELRPRTSLIVMNHASNVTGTILPAADVAAIARGKGIPILLDAAQTAGRLRIDAEAEGIDIIAFTGHKELFGPQGTGGLYAREGLEINPLMCGGTGSRSSSLEQPEEMPDRFESGTLNAPGIAGLGAGVRFVAGEGVTMIREHELGLMGRLLRGLAGMKGVRVHGPQDPDKRLGIVPLTFERHSPTGAGEMLDRRYGISCRAGLHCSPMAHRTAGTVETGALRVSFSYLNTSEEVDYLLDCLAEFA